MTSYQRHGSKVKPRITRLFVPQIVEANKTNTKVLKWYGKAFPCRDVIMCDMLLVIWYSYMMTSSNGNISTRCWPIVKGIHRSPMDSPHRGRWRGALMLSLICNGWASNRDAGDFRRHLANYDVTVTILSFLQKHMRACNCLDVYWVYKADVKQLTRKW